MSNRTKKSAVILMIIILISKVTGFSRDIILANTFGAGDITDAYLTALNIPVILFNGISAALGTTFIPMFFNVKEKEGDKGVNLFTSNIINITIVISIIFIVIGIIFAPYIVKIFAMGFKGEVLELTIDYLKILLFSMIFIAANGIMSSYLVAKGNVYISGLISIPFNIFVIIAIVIGSFTNSYVMVLGTLIAYIVQLLFQIPFLIKIGYAHSFKINLRDENINHILYLVIPVFFGSYVNQINAIVNRTLASTLETGSITALNYANKLSMFAVGIIVVSLTTVMYPILSKLANENNIKLFKHNLSKSINIIIIVMVPITIIMMDFSSHIVRILFEEGSFNSYATQLTSSALFYSSIGIVAFGIREILAKAFYSLKDTKTPVRNATISVCINVIASIILVRYMKIGGLALANSMSSTITAVLLFISLRKKIGKIGFKNILINFIKVLFASILMIITINFVYDRVIILGFGLLAESRKFIAINMIISSTIGIFIYAMLSIILNIKEARDLINIVLSKLNRVIVNKK